MSLLPERRDRCRHGAGERMTRKELDPHVIAEVLTAHWPIAPFRCECGQTFPVSHSFAQQREHVAEAVRDALERELRGNG